MANPSIETDVKIGESEPTLDVTVTSSVSIPKEIFTYAQTLEQDTLGCYISYFSHVASLSDLQNYSPSSPAEGQSYFRLESLSKEFDSYKELYDFYEELKKKISCLLCARKSQLLFEETCFSESYSSDNC